MTVSPLFRKSQFVHILFIKTCHIIRKLVLESTIIIDKVWYNNCNADPARGLPDREV